MRCPLPRWDLGDQPRHGSSRAWGVLDSADTKAGIPVAAPDRPARLRRTLPPAPRGAHAERHSGTWRVGFPRAHDQGDIPVARVGAGRRGDTSNRACAEADGVCDLGESLCEPTEPGHFPAAPRRWAETAVLG